jgi:hypothetical protein
MANIESAYESYLLKVEKNGINDNLSTSRDRFVIAYNEAQNKYTEFHLQNRGIDDVRYIEHLLILDKRISTSSKTSDHQDFILPKGYLDLADIRAKGSQGECRGQAIDLFDIKRAENISEILKDEDNKPSFKWREAPYLIASNKVSVYTDNTFSVDEILLSYYRYPTQIALVDPYDPESNFDETLKIEWDAKSLDRIISLTAGEFDLNTNNPRFQVQNARAQK